MKRLLLIPILLTFVLVGCVRFDEPEPIQNPEAEIEAVAATRSGITPTYKVLPDPYALANMQAVYNLAENPITLKPTHLYVRFKPQSQEQLERLENDYGLDLYDYPLDIEIPEGEEYVDPTIPEGELGWYYIGVETDFAFPAGIICDRELGRLEINV